MVVAQPLGNFTVRRLRSPQPPRGATCQVLRHDSLSHAPEDRVHGNGCPRDAEDHACNGQGL
eukprot:1149766-Pelagomonas_calceolata.AAC.14